MCNSECPNCKNGYCMELLFLRDWEGILGRYYACIFCHRLFHWQYPNKYIETIIRESEKEDINE